MQTDTNKLNQYHLDYIKGLVTSEMLLDMKPGCNLNDAIDIYRGVLDKLRPTIKENTDYNVWFKGLTAISTSVLLLSYTVTYGIYESYTEVEEKATVVLDDDKQLTSMYLDRGEYMQQEQTTSIAKTIEQDVYEQLSGRQIVPVSFTDYEELIKKTFELRDKSWLSKFGCNIYFKSLRTVTTLTFELIATAIGRNDTKETDICILLDFQGKVPQLEVNIEDGEKSDNLRLSNKLFDSDDTPPNFVLSKQIEDAKVPAYIVTDNTKEAGELAKDLRSKLLGWFKFNRNDREELERIRQKLQDCLADMSNNTVILYLNNVYYDIDAPYYLIVIASKLNTVKNTCEVFNLWIDYSETECCNTKPTESVKECKSKPEFNPYSKEALQNLTVKQFLTLCDTIETIKEDFE